MLTVKTYVAPSNIHGFGLFAGEDIPKGTVIWKFHPNIDYRFSGKEFAEILKNIDDYGLKHLLNTCYKSDDYFYYVTDDARFINHNEQRSNIGPADENTEVALKDIKKGEEIVENYYNCYDEDDFFFYEAKLKNFKDYINIINK